MIPRGRVGGPRIRPVGFFSFSIGDLFSTIWFLHVGLDVKGTNHVECDYVLEGDVACSVFFDEGFVHQLGTTSCRKAENKGLFGRQGMGFDPFC
jgi:hypothetical protein